MRHGSFLEIRKQVKELTVANPTERSAMKVSSVSPLQVELTSRSIMYGTESKYLLMCVHILRI